MKTRIQSFRPRKYFLIVRLKSIKSFKTMLHCFWQCARAIVKIMKFIYTMSQMSKNVSGPQQSVFNISHALNFDQHVA
jgi:hypothetical protein